MDPVVHFEIPADNLERAQEFYNRVFWMENAASCLPELHDCAHSRD